MKTYSLMDQGEYSTILVAGKDIGSVWFMDGEWHGEFNRTGCSWVCDSKEDAIQVVLNQ